MSSLGTILTAIVTPFDEQGNVDEESFVALMHHLAEHGSDGFVVCGTTGEAATLTDSEHLGLIGLAVRERPAGTTVVGGTGSNDTKHAMHLTEVATELGVDATLSVTPYYNKPSPRGIVRHYEEVARSHRQADPALQHPGTHRGQHGPGPACALGTDRARRGRQAVKCG